MPNFHISWNRTKINLKKKLDDHVSTSVVSAKKINKSQESPIISINETSRCRQEKEAGLRELTLVDCALSDS